MNRKLQEVFQVRDNVIYSVTGDTCIKDAVDKLNKHSIGALIVLDDKGKIEGIFTERDVMLKLASTDELVGHLPVKEIMSKKDRLVTISGDEPITEIMQIMMESKVRHLPIVDDKDVLHGVVAMRDIFKILLKDAKQESKDMKNYVMGQYPV